MKHKLWIKLTAFIIGSLLSINIFLNYYTDPNFIFTKQTNKPLKCLTFYGGPNERFLKINYILENKDKYDSFIFGSSRVGKMNMNLLEQNKFYNMNYAGGYPKEHLSIIKLFIKNKVAIKNIWIGLDDFSYAIPDEQPFNWSLSRPHWEMKLKENDTIFKFYSYYLLRLVSLKDIEARLNQLLNKDMDFYLYNLYTTGMPSAEPKNEWIEHNKEEHKSDKVFLKPYVFATGHHIDNTLNDLKEIQKLCIENNIQLTFFINPLHKTTYLNDNFKELITFKEGLATITDYYDFAYLNTITTNNYYYFETSHYRNVVGDFIIKSINSKDNDFGKYITKENFQSHKKFLVDNLNVSK